MRISNVLRITTNNGYSITIDVLYMQQDNIQERIDRSFFQPETEFTIKNDLYKHLDQLEPTAGDKNNVEPLFNRIFDAIEATEKLQKRNKVIKLIRIIGSRAAILVAGMLLYMFVIQPLFKTSSKSAIKFFAPDKSVTQTILPDGSTIYLNSNSELTYKIDPSNKLREVFLKGEGWFNIAKMPETPFIVHTDQYSVKVHGTVFNIKAYAENENVVTTLQEGSIEILPENGTEIKPVMLVPGQQFSYNKRSETTLLTNVNASITSVWKEPEIRFENKKFIDLLKILENKYNVEFKVSDTSLLNYHYDGSIRNENIIQVLNLIKETLPIKYQLLNNNVIQIDKQEEKINLKP